MASAGTSRAPGLVRRSEQPGGLAGLAAEGVRPGEAGERLRHGLRVAELPRGGEAVKMP